VDRVEDEGFDKMMKMRMNFVAKVEERTMKIMSNEVEMRMKGLFEVSEDE
jgi:hypothetical protein